MLTEALWYDKRVREVSKLASKYQAPLLEDSLTIRRENEKIPGDFERTHIQFRDKDLYEICIHYETISTTKTNSQIEFVGIQVRNL